MFKKKILLLLVFIFSLFVGSAVIFNYEVDAVSSYYSSISSNDYGSSLKSSLRTLISKQTYYSSYNDCKDPDIIRQTDGNSNNSKIVLFWSDIEVSATWDSGNTWNREHVWPQSKGWFETSGAGADLHHIRPTDNKVNGTHGNHPYGIVSTDDYCQTGSLTGSKMTEAKCNGSVFEPGDSKKGDTARIIFYLLVRYSESETYPITNVATSMEMLLAWNRLDPVDNSEIKRNEAVYDIQGNRNPFIDDSFYADLIWGGAKPGDNPGADSGSSGGNDTGSNEEDESGTTRPPVTNVSGEGKVATFEFGANDTTKKDIDDGTALTKYSETNNNYTLNLYNLSKVYTSFDGLGNSCLKLGSSSSVGKFDFDVPEDIDQVLILVTGYKTNPSTVSINGSSNSLSTTSKEGEYTNYLVDTTITKTISIATTSSGYRCKVNTIVFYDLDSVEPSEPETGNTGLITFETLETKASLIVDYQYNTYTTTSNGSYSYEFSSQQFSSATGKILNGVNWDVETTLKNASGSKHYGYDNSKGQQFGSKNNPFKEVILKTTDNFLEGVTSVTINASGASGTTAEVSAYVGSTQIGKTQKLTTSSEKYTFTSATGLSGNVKFVITQTSSAAIYIKGMSMTYASEIINASEYSLNSAAIRFGSYISKDLYDQLNEEGTKWGVEYAAGTVSNWDSSNVNTIYCTPAQVASPNATTTSADGNYYQWALVVRNLGYSHLDKAISARVFVEYQGVRYYMTSTTYSIRSLASSYLSNGVNGNQEAILKHINNYQG